jgi:hypothetical protein
MWAYVGLHHIRFYASYTDSGSNLALHKTSGFALAAPSLTRRTVGDPQAPRKVASV